MFLVTGGTGTLGRLVVPQLLQAGGKVRVLSRHPREAAEGIEFAVGDLDTGRGIDAAVAGAEVIVHCAGSQKGDGDKTRTLVRAAGRLAELALGSPSGLVPDLAGPRVYPMADLIQSYLRAAGKRRPVVPVPLPGRAAKAVRDGANLAPGRAVGRRTWEEFLAERVRR